MPPVSSAVRRCAAVLLVLVATGALLAQPAWAQKADDGELGTEPPWDPAAWLDEVLGRFGVAWDAAVGTKGQAAAIERFKEGIRPEITSVAGGQVSRAREPQRPSG